MSDKFWEMFDDYAPLWLINYVWGWIAFSENWNIWRKSFTNCIYLSVFDGFCVDYTDEIGEVSRGAWTEDES